MKKTIMILVIIMFCQIFAFNLNVYATEDRTTDKSTTTAKTDSTKTTEKSTTTTKTDSTKTTDESTTKNSGLSDAMSGATKFINKGSEEADELFDNTKLNEASSTVYNILLAIGTATAFIIGAVLGIQFMLGGAEEQAKIKESLIPYGIGCVIVFGAFGIWALVVNVMKLF